jgi:hypothetical protein
MRSIPSAARQHAFAGRRVGVAPSASSRARKPGRARPGRRPTPAV